MPGKPGMKGEGLGGRRKGAGRPIKRVSMTAGDKFCATTISAENRQSGFSELWEVVEVSRSVIWLKSSTGETIKLVR